MENKTVKPPLSWPNHQMVEQVQYFKYFGTENDTCLSVTQHTNTVY